MMKLSHGSTAPSMIPLTRILFPFLSDISTTPLEAVKSIRQSEDNKVFKSSNVCNGGKTRSNLMLQDIKECTCDDPVGSSHCGSNQVAIDADTSRFSSSANRGLSAAMITNYTEESGSSYARACNQSTATNSQSHKRKNRDGEGQNARERRDRINEEDERPCKELLPHSTKDDVSGSGMASMMFLSNPFDTGCPIQAAMCQNSMLNQVNYQRHLQKSNFPDQYAVAAGFPSTSRRFSGYEHFGLSSTHSPAKSAVTASN
ncbi:transcription factor [Datura stramonium]|uniref:Transcription factor n=1 Tax=Datura stramonium TaxID=4076 RepID=A0ABS8VDK1_DATST|nr:transcription factor [Datura stramonium]